MERTLIDEGLMTLGKVAHKCNVSPSMLWRLCVQGKLECVRTSKNGRWLTTAAAFARYLNGIRPAPKIDVIDRQKRADAATKERRCNIACMRGMKCLMLGTGTANSLNSSGVPT